MELEELVRALRRQSYRPSDIAALLDLSIASVYRMIACGELTGIKVRGCLRVNKNDLAAYISRIGLQVDPTVLDGGRR